MKCKKINNSWVIVFKKDEKVIEKLIEFVKARKIKAGYFSAIGAISQVEFAHYDLRKKKYKTKSIKQQLEIASLTGNVATKGKEIIIHAHVVVGTDKMAAYGGHLREATVAATCEVMFTAFKTRLKRRYDKNIGLNLIDLREK